MYCVVDDIASHSSAALDLFLRVLTFPGTTYLYRVRFHAASRHLTEHSIVNPTIHLPI